MPQMTCLSHWSVACARIILSSASSFLCFSLAIMRVVFPHKPHSRIHTTTTTLYRHGLRCDNVHARLRFLDQSWWSGKATCTQT